MLPSILFIFFKQQLHVKMLQFSQNPTPIIMWISDFEQSVENPKVLWIGMNKNKMNTISLWYQTHSFLILNTKIIVKGKQFHINQKIINIIFKFWTRCQCWKVFLITIHKNKQNTLPLWYLVPCWLIFIFEYPNWLGLYVNNFTIKYP